jgi:hypothetical protein
MNRRNARKERAMLEQRKLGTQGLQVYEAEDDHQPLADEHFEWACVCHADNEMS